MTTPLIVAPIAVVAAAAITFYLWYRAKHASPAVPLAPSPVVGLVVHEGTPADLNRLLSIGKAPRVRTTDYGDAISYSRLQAFGGNLIPTLTIIPLAGQPRYLAVTSDLQLGNEPDTTTITPEQYGAAFRANRAALRVTAPSSTKIVTAGFSNSASLDWITRALRAGAKDADAICFHVYGDDLVQALAARLAVLGQAMAAAACTQPLWITEVGFPAVDPMKQLAQVTAFFARSKPPAIERIYVYALATDELTDFYGVCAHDAPRTPRPAYAAVRAAMAAHP
jgi:hypothetical protein